MNNPISPSKHNLLWSIPAAELVVFVLSGLALLILGAWSWTNFGMALMITGSATIVVGVLGFLLASGPVAVDCSETKTRRRSASPLQRGACFIATYMSGWGFVLLLGLAGLIALGAGFLIAKLAEL